MSRMQRIDVHNLMPQARELIFNYYEFLVSRYPLIPPRPEQKHRHPAKNFSGFVAKPIHVTRFKMPEREGRNAR